MSGTREGEGSKGICARVSLWMVRAMDVAVCAHPLQGHLGMPALHTGTSVWAELCLGARV